MANGLKKLRAKTGKAPTYECANCRCKRYSPCTCMKSGETPLESETPQTEKAAPTPDAPDKSETSETSNK